MKMQSVFNLQGSDNYELEQLDELKKNFALEEMFKSITHIVKDQLERIMKEEGGDEKFIFT